MDHWWTILVFWGGWLLIPFVVDGFATAWHFVLSFQMIRPARRLPLPDHNLPQVSIIIPAYNESADIDHCLLSLYAQTYPHHRLEVIVVDDGSEDDTANIVFKHVGHKRLNQRYLRTNSFVAPLKSFGGTISLVRLKRTAESGKPMALNAGLAVASGEFIICMDADIVLAPDAIEQAVRAFLHDPTLIAATGHLVIDSYLVVEQNERGDVRLDQQGIPIPRLLTLSERILTACQFLEYVAAFHLGRRSESYIDGIFSVSGACTVFRPEVFKAVLRYRRRTVTEDADITLALHRLKDFHIGYLPEMRVHLAPILTWTQLYIQRVRWQRGVLEVSAIHHLRKKNPRKKWYLWNVVLPLHLQVNHTLAFPRLVWTLVLFMLPIFGYRWELIGQVALFIYSLYLAISIFRTLVAYLFSSISEKIYIRKYLSYLVVYPFYKTVLFWVHLSADIRTLTENARWTVDIPLLNRLAPFKKRDVRRAQ